MLRIRCQSIHHQSRCCIKELCNTNAFTTAGGVVSGDTKLNVGSDLIRSLGCNNITTGKKFTLLLGTDTNMLSYSFPNSGLPVPVKIKLMVVLPSRLISYLYATLVRM